MKHHLFLTLCAVCLAAPAVHAASLNLHNTGVDASGTKLAVSLSDPHWTVTPGILTTSSTPAIVINDQMTSIYAQSSASSWIYQNASASGTGNNTFGLEFDLSAFDSSSVLITGDFAVDNEASIYLNGTNIGIGSGALTQTGYVSAAFTGWHSFTLNNGFLPGMNRIDFVVNNIDSVGGLNVRLTGEANPIPEPAATGLLGLSALGLLRRRTRA